MNFKTYNCNLQIGDIRISFIFPSCSWKKAVEKNYSSFLSGKAKSAKIAVCSGISGCVKSKKPVILKGNKNEWQIKGEDFCSISSTDLAETKLYVKKNRFSFDSWLRMFLTLYGLEKMGLLLHGAGHFMKDIKNTVLFLGPSGRGKSSITRILGKKQALSDELVFVYQKNGKFISSSTPFWGELKKGSGNVYSAPVKGLYFLSHGKRLAIQKIKQGEALKKLLKTVLFFSKDTKTFRQAFSIAAEITEKIPAYNLSFALNTKKHEIINEILRG